MDSVGDFGVRQTAQNPAARVHASSLFVLSSPLKPCYATEELSGAVMANRRTHRKAGRIAGGVYAAHRAKDQGVVKCAAETLGGVFGGDLGAVLADVIEPGLSSWPRGMSHSWAAGAGVLSLGGVLIRPETHFL